MDYDDHEEEEEEWQVGEEEHLKGPMPYFLLCNGRYMVYI